MILGRPGVAFKRLALSWREWGLMISWIVKQTHSLTIIHVGVGETVGQMQSALFGHVSTLPMQFLDIQVLPITTF